MKSSNPLSVRSSRWRRAAGLVLLVGSLALAHAGTPLICHPYAVGADACIPGTAGDWKGVNPAYDRKTLTADTLAVLTPQKPILVRMETLRRAAIYASAGMRGWDRGTYTKDDRAAAAELVSALRARVASSQGDERALAQFDLGFLAETLRQVHLDPGVDGHEFLLQALAARKGDPEIEFALALATQRPLRDTHAAHLARARAGARPGTLLAANLASHFRSS